MLGLYEEAGLKPVVAPEVEFFLVHPVELENRREFQHGSANVEAMQKSRWKTISTIVGAARPQDSVFGESIVLRVLEG